MARSTFKVLFYVNGSKEKDGIVPIMGRVTINGTVAQFSCKQTIPKTLWDVKGNRAKGKSAEARNVNLALDNIKAQIIKHYQRISDREAYVTAEMVRNAYQGVGSEYETLIKAFDKDCANFLKRVGKDRSIGTYKVMVRARNYVAAFIKSFYRRTDMSMLELTPDFIKEFAAYLTAERGLKNATIWLNCMWLKGVVMRAHYNGLIPRNPFAQFLATALASSVGSLFGSNKVKTLERENAVLHREVATHEETIEALQTRIQTMQTDYSRQIVEIERKHRREIAVKEAKHEEEISFLKTVIARAAAWFPYFREMLRIENFCRLVGFDEKQTATLVKGKPLEYAGELYSEEHGRKFTTEKAGFQVVKDPTDGTRLVLAIDQKPLIEWFKEQSDKLFTSIRKRPIFSQHGKKISL